MRKLYYFLLLMITCIAANGQIKKNSILLGGQLFYYNNQVKVDGKVQQFESGTIGLSIGKAFKENKVFGINFTFTPIRQHNNVNFGDTTDVTYNRYDPGVFYREYKTLAKDFYFFAQVDAAYITGKQTEHYQAANADVTATQKGGYIAITPGISYQVFKIMQLEIVIPNIISLQYLMTKVDSEMPQVKDSEQQQFVFYTSFTNNSGLGFLGVGFRFIL